MKIYVASSWRNLLQPSVVATLRELGHDVYDFRNPPNKSGFGWEQVNPRWNRADGAHIDCEPYRAMVNHPIAQEGYAADIGALRDCDACVYVLPCGRSASWEFGYAMGRGKRCFVLWVGAHEPELMFREATIVGSLDDLARVVSRSTSSDAARAEPEEQRRQGASGVGEVTTPVLSVASGRASRLGVSGLEGGK